MITPGRHKFDIKSKGGPKNEIIVDYICSYCHMYSFRQFFSFNPDPRTIISERPDEGKGKGALKDAISLYSQIADNSNANQSLRARALLHKL